MQHKPRIGFTIIELIIVIAIIGILVGILYPAIAGGRKQAMKVRELALASQVGKAWSMYTSDHLGKLLTGYISTEAQEYRDLAWALPNEDLVPPAPNYLTSSPNDAGPWTWRLMSYLENDWRSITPHLELSEFTDESEYDNVQIIAEEPAFGYNGYYLGGWEELDTHSQKPTSLFSSVRLTDGTRENVVTKIHSGIRRTNHQIVFCSTFLAEPGIYSEMGDHTPGTYMAIPSVLARFKKWELLIGGEIEAHANTYAPLGRFNGMPAVHFADGSSKAMEISELLDQSKWISKARTIGDISASNFSHTID